MKRTGFTTIIALAALCFFITACSEQKPATEKAATEKAKVEKLETTPQDIKKEAEDLAKTTAAYTEEQKTLYQQEIEAKMAEYSQNLAEMQTKLVTMSEQARAGMASELEDLNRKKAEMAQKAAELQAASGQAYADLKAGLDKAMEEMDKAFGQAMERFQK
jgi:apolipoprotein N-acyltransferase